MIRVLKKGEFYCEKTDSYYYERDVIDSEIEFVVFDRNGKVGIVENGCYVTHIHWIDEDDKDSHYIVLRGETK